MSEEKREKKRVRMEVEDVEELKEVLSVVADRVPALVKGLMSSVFSEESAANLGKAAATFFKELKAGGLPDDVATRMTQDYVATFTKISDFIRSGAARGKEDEDIKGAIFAKLKRELDKEDK